MTSWLSGVFGAVELIGPRCGKRGPARVRPHRGCRNQVCGRLPHREIAQVDAQQEGEPQRGVAVHAEPAAPLPDRGIADAQLGRFFKVRDLAPTSLAFERLLKPDHIQLSQAAILLHAVNYLSFRPFSARFSAAYSGIFFKAVTWLYAFQEQASGIVMTGLPIIIDRSVRPGGE